MTDKFVPESVRAKLVVGQRVRYVPDVECDAPPAFRSESTRYKATLHEGYTNAEEQTGRIISTNNVSLKGHPYKLKMDAKYEFGGSSFNYITVAAHELALVED